MKFGNVKLPKELWMCEDEQARWFEFEQPHDLPDSVTVTKMIPEQAEKQEPVVEHAPCQGMNCGITRTDQEHSPECQAEHAATIAGGVFVKMEQAEKQEPVAFRCWNNPQNADGTFDILRIWLSEKPEGYGNEPLYTAPPPRQPLTDEEVERLVDEEDWYNDPHGFARAIEAAHGIKENT